MPPEGQEFTRGTPNSWAPMSADEKLGLVYVPTGNATPDYYGGHRTANDDRFSSSVVALNAESGDVRWSFQTTHHDLWDYDVPAQPKLVDLPGGVQGLLQPTKRGEILFLDRRTGKPIARVEERPVPQGAVPGERLAQTQSFSTGLPSFGGPRPSEKSMWGLTPIDQAMCRIRFKQARFEGTMTPLGIDRPTLTWPGYLGGIDWGGISVDKGRHLMFVNNNQVSNYNRLLTRATADRLGVKPMTAAHMSDVGGPVPQAGVPYAANIAPFLSPLAVPCQQPPYGMVSAVDIKSGKLDWTRRYGTRRARGQLALQTFLPLPVDVPEIGRSTGKSVGERRRVLSRSWGVNPMTAAHMSDGGGPVPVAGVTYAAIIAPFLSPRAVPSQQPPYGMVGALDPNSGRLVWTRRFGTSRDSGPLALPTFLPIPMGVPNIGGSVATASGLMFIGATQEHMLRAYDSRTGQELWKNRLPAGGQATPATYWSPKSKRQFVVIAAGGHGAMLSGSSDTLIAFALPKASKR